MFSVDDDDDGENDGIITLFVKDPIGDLFDHELDYEEDKNNDAGDDSYELNACQTTIKRKNRSAVGAPSDTNLMSSENMYRFCLRNAWSLFLSVYGDSPAVIFPSASPARIGFGLNVSSENAAPHNNHHRTETTIMEMKTSCSDDFFPPAELSALDSTSCPWNVYQAPQGQLTALHEAIISYASPRIITSILNYHSRPNRPCFFCCCVHTILDQTDSSVHRKRQHDYDDSQTSIYFSCSTIVTVQDKFGHSSLHKAVLQEELSYVSTIIPLLLDFDPTCIMITDRLGFTPLHLLYQRVGSFDPVNCIMPGRYGYYHQGALYSHWNSDDDDSFEDHTSFSTRRFNKENLHHSTKEESPSLTNMDIFHTLTQMIVSYCDHPSQLFLLKDKIQERTALHEACAYNKSMQVISLLLQYCPECIRQADSFGDTPLHIVCSCWTGADNEDLDDDDDDDVNNSSNGIQTLLSKIEMILAIGPDTFLCQNKQGRTPLHHAIFHFAHRHVIEYLLAFEKSRLDSFLILPPTIEFSSPTIMIDSNSSTTDRQYFLNNQTQVMENNTTFISILWNIDTIGMTPIQLLHRLHEDSLMLFTKEPSPSHLRVIQDLRETTAQFVHTMLQSNLFPKLVTIGNETNVQGLQPLSISLTQKYIVHNCLRLGHVCPIINYIRAEIRSNPLILEECDCFGDFPLNILMHTMKLCDHSIYHLFIELGQDMITLRPEICSLMDGNGILPLEIMMSAFRKHQSFSFFKLVDKIFLVNPGALLYETMWPCLLPKLLLSTDEIDPINHLNFLYEVLRHAPELLCYVITTDIF